MAYYMRFIETSTEPSTLRSLDATLRSVDSRYRVDEEGQFLFDEERFGVVELNRAGEELFESERQEFLVELEELEDGPGVEAVRRVLRAATASVVLQVLRQGGSTDETFDRINSLWEALLARGQGLLQVDNEGSYDSEKLLVDLSFP